MWVNKKIKKSSKITKTSIFLFMSRNFVAYMCCLALIEFFIHCYIQFFEVFSC